MKTVSKFSDMWRFISAIWNSYSKSLTARRPRMLSLAPIFLAKSTSSPSNCVTSTCLLSAVAARMSYPFFGREQRALRGIHGDRHNEVIDELAAPLDQVLVAARD